MRSTKARINKKSYKTTVKKQRVITSPKLNVVKWSGSNDNSKIFNKTILCKRVIKAMSLDELLEVSYAADIIFKGGESPKLNSGRGQKLVQTISVLNSCPSTRYKAENINDDIGRQIVQKNKATVNSEKSKRVYMSFLKEDNK